jgi:hypothetical protein
MWPRLGAPPTTTGGTVAGVASGGASRGGTDAFVVVGGRELGVLEPAEWNLELLARLACYAMATEGKWRKAVWRLRTVWHARQARQAGRSEGVVCEVLPSDVEEAIRSLGMREGEMEDEGEVYLPPPEWMVATRKMTDEEAADALVRMAVWSG